MKFVVLSFLALSVSALGAGPHPHKNVFLERTAPTVAPAANAPATAAAAPAAATVAATVAPKPTTTMKTTAHEKAAGAGYAPGSPLYDKQEKEAANDGWVKWGEDLGPTTKLTFMQQLIGALVSVLISCIFGWLYFSYVRPNEPRFAQDRIKNVTQHQTDFSHGLCDNSQCCGDDRCMCFYAWCCPSARWADTVSHGKVGMMAFWPAFFIFCLLNNFRSIQTYHIGGTLGFILLIIVIYTRQQIRKKYNIVNGTVSTVALDCLTWCCCAPCAIVQEARQAEQARKQ